MRTIAQESMPLRGIMGVDIKNAPAMLVTSRGATWKVIAPMHDQSTRHSLRYAYRTNRQVPLTCEHCGGAFTTYPAEVRKAEARGSRVKYCSRECRKAAFAAGNTDHICETCGTTFTVWASTRRHAEAQGWTPGRFCSVACAERGDYRRQRGGRTEVPCDYCGTMLSRINARLNGRQYCDMQCYTAHRRQMKIERYTKPCVVCGELLTLRDGETIPNFRKRLTCSEACRIERYVDTRCGEEGPDRTYPPEFNDVLRERIRDRDGYACQECGVIEDGTRVHDVHHIDYDKHNCDESNLITLCLSCHRKTTNSSKRNQWVTRYQRLMEARVERWQ